MGDAELSAVHDAIEKAVTILFYCFLAALIASGSVFPPSPAAIYGPLLLALLAGVSGYAAARGIQVPPGTPPRVPP